MTGHVLDDTKARAFIKVSIPKSMWGPNIPEVERLGFDSKSNAKAAITYLLKAGIQAKME